jgi:hypothetical protein
MSNGHDKRRRQGKGRALARRKRGKKWQETGRRIRREQRAGNDQWWPIDGESAEPDSGNVHGEGIDR